MGPIAHNGSASNELTAEYENTLDLNEDMLPLNTRLSSLTPVSSLSCTASPPPLPPVQYGHTVTARPHHIPTMPSLPRSDMNRESFLPTPFRQGYTPGPKPKAADYQDDVEKMLLRAIHEYSCLILSTDAFPHKRKQTQWAEKTWKAACDEVGVHYVCSLHMVRLVRPRRHCRHYHTAEYYLIDHNSWQLGAWLLKGCGSQ
jgi:hypothetical protein